MTHPSRTALIALAPLALVAATSAKWVIYPGKWSVRADITDLQMPGAPPGIAKLFAKHPQVWRGCVTPADAAKGPPMNPEPGASCTVTRTPGAGASFTAHQVCTRSDGERSVTDLSGTYTPDHFDAVGTTVVTGKRPMTLKLKFSGRREGGC